MRLRVTLVALLALTVPFTVWFFSKTGQANIKKNFGAMAMSFESNIGQTDARVKFLSRGKGYTLFLTGNEAVLSLKKGDRDSQQSSTLRMEFVGANESPTVTGLHELPGRTNYFIGNDPAAWRRNIPNYQSIQYQDLYPGIDLVYYGKEQQLEYDLIVKPHADPCAITLQFDSRSSID